MSEYWKIFAEEFLSDEMGLNLTKEQIDNIADAAAGHAENEGLATGRDCIPNPQTLEIKELKAIIKDERNKVFCKSCNGTGRIYTAGPHHGSISDCWKCNGEGKHKP